MTINLPISSILLSELIIGFFAAVIAIQVFYYLFFFLRLAIYKKPKKTVHVEHPVSVVICARDEAHNLANTLPGVLVQEYSTTHEVVLVNDNSEDETKYLLDEFKKSFKNLNPVHLTQEAKMIAGKKFPLSMGIKSAKNETLLLTDADCLPASEHWMRLMQDGYDEGIEIVLGYGAYKKKPGLINTKATPGCRMESKTEVYPRPNNHSHNLAVKLSPMGWNCLYGNTHNTMHALGHGKMFTNNITTPATLDNNNYFSTLVSILNNQGYCIAFSRLMTNDNSLKFKELDKCINSAKVPSLIILNITYSGNQSRRHLIGIVPSVMIDKRTEMHIVDGCHPKQKSIPLNKVNFRWCCSGSISFYVEQFAVFTPGKKSVAYLEKGGGLEHQAFYQTKKTTEELLESIPIDYRQSKKRRRM